jgi:outer membrane lipoprotein carrier protein
MFRRRLLTRSVRDPGVSPRRTRARFVAFLCVLCASVPGFSGARASGIDRLNEFMGSTLAATGEFEQRIYSREQKLVQESRGSLAFLRPGKFRWVYSKPYSQLIVGDGARVWVYDEDLNQVTVRKLDQALGATPAALLAGASDALKAFALKDEGTKDGLEWVEAVPRDRESTFERIRMGFGFSGLERMELADTFGQTTELRFTALRRNPRVDPALFRFTPPKGADVVGDR